MPKKPRPKLHTPLIRVGGEKPQAGRLKGSPPVCPRCDGRKTIIAEIDNGEVERVVCPACHGADVGSSE